MNFIKYTNIRDTKSRTVLWNSVMELSCKVCPVRFVMNMSYPAIGKEDLVTCIIPGSYDTGIGQGRGDRRRGAEGREQHLDPHAVPGQHGTTVDRHDLELPSFTFAEPMRALQHILLEGFLCSHLRIWKRLCFCHDEIGLCGFIICEECLYLY